MKGLFLISHAIWGLKELYLWPINADQQGTPQQVRKVVDMVKKKSYPGSL